MRIARSARISPRARLDRTNPRGIVIGAETYVAAWAVVLAHDYCRGKRCETRIGSRCFVGVNAIVLPGVRIGDSVVVGAGSVVTRDVASGCVVAGNPARVVRVGVRTGRYGLLVQT